MTALPDDVRALFEGPNYAHIATVLPDGGPHSVPVWIGMHDGRIAFFTRPGTRKGRNLARDPRVAISIVDFEQPYRMAQVRGRVTGMLEDDEAFAVIDALSNKYTGQPFPMRSGLSIYLIEAETVQSMELPFSHTPAA